MRLQAGSGYARPSRPDPDPILRALTLTIHLRPAGPADSEELSAVQTASWQAAYRDVLSPSVLQRVNTVWGVGHWRRVLSDIERPGATLVIDSYAEGRLLGFGTCGPQRSQVEGYAGEIYALYLLPEAQRIGHGRRLMGALARVLKAQNMGTALVWALSVNLGARRFYEALGGKPLGPRMVHLFGEDMAEAGYGWDDLEDLCALGLDEDGPA